MNSFHRVASFQSLLLSKARVQIGMQKITFLFIFGIVILSFPWVLTKPQHGNVLKQVEIDCIKRPRPYKIADQEQCDKYYICDNGVATPKLCEDGTVFDFLIQNCVLLLNGADCDGRPLLQESIKTNHCPKKTGLFPHEDPAQCDKYYQCLDGHPTLIKCPEMLLFNRMRGVCDYADLTDTANCLLEPSPVVCPSGNVVSSSLLDAGNRLIAHPKDCNKFFLCETTIPRPLACEKHLAFDLETSSCIEKSKVRRCTHE